MQSEEKKLKAQHKTQSAALTQATIAAIQNLSDAEALELLRKKWFAPLIAAMHELPQQALADFCQQLAALCAKYADTYADLHTQSRQSAAELAQMMNGLTGDEFDLAGIKGWQAILGDKQ